MKEVLEFLAAPFDPAEADLKVQTTSKDRSRGMVVSYIDARTVQNHLDEVAKTRLLQDLLGNRRLVPEDRPFL